LAKSKVKNINPRQKQAINVNLIGVPAAGRLETLYCCSWLLVVAPSSSNRY